MPTATQIAVTQMTMNAARCQALFASRLQPSDAPTADMVATAISRAVQQFGIRGCAGRMAQEFGDHPDTAAGRMRWARQLIASTGPTARTRENRDGHRVEPEQVTEVLRANRTGTARELT